MYVESVISINNGWSMMTIQKKEEWEAVEKSIHQIDESFLSRLTQSITESKTVKYDYVYYVLYNSISHYLRSQRGWTGDLPGVGLDVNSHIPSIAKQRAVKNGVYATLVGINEITGGNFTTMLYVNSPHFYKLEAANISVILVPTSETIKHLLKSGIDLRQIESLPDEDVCRTQLAKFGAPISQAPVVLAFFSPSAPREITVEELTSLTVAGHTIERTIEFAPEHYQAGVGLLSYFGEVLRQKDPNTKAKVRIEQDGRFVRLHIESPTGEIETIEKELDQYALVISNQAPPESLFENRAHIMRLEHSLEMMSHQVKMAKDLKELTEGLHTQRVNNLEEQVDFLKKQVAAQLLQTGQVINLVAQQSNSHEQIQMALLTQSGLFFKDILQEASGNQRLAEAVNDLRHNLLSGMAIIDVEDKLEAALTTIKETKPGFLGRILKELEGAAYKASASSTVTWVATWLAAHAQ